MRRLLVACALLLAGCGGGDEDAITIYLSQRLGPEGPPGQVAPVLAPVEREPCAGIAAAHQALLTLHQGPSPRERARGFLPTFPLDAGPVASTSARAPRPSISPAPCRWTFPALRLRSTR